ncbi:MAG TPA: hypothetical protein VE399_06100 [Gemmatimonadales bacterium]|jgi:hypothetical protein|nr:hypothetical protein [Gemmatimonadales bacterium]
MLSAALFPRFQATIVLLTGLTLALSAGSTGRERTLRGTKANLGGGTVQSFLRLDAEGAPAAVGVALSAGALEGLPQSPNTVSRCFDLDGNGRHTQHECIGDEERLLDLPAGVGDKLPFRWISVNWNAHGHIPPYNRPHFDFHFHTGPREQIEAIAPGRCGELVDCGDFKRASHPVAARYLPSGYIDVGAVVPRMGNHLLDSQSPELKDSLPFTSTFIYGAWEGELIFWEPMITLDFLRNTAQACMKIPQPQAFRQAGYYPTQYCVRQDGQGGRTVTLEGFRYAEAL